MGTSTAVRRLSASGRVAEGIGFAIDADTTFQVTQQLAELGFVLWAWMGVILADLIPEIAAEVGLPIRERMVIQDTIVGGPANRRTARAFGLAI